MILLERIILLIQTLLKLWPIYAIAIIVYIIQKKKERKRKSSDNINQKSNPDVYTPLSETELRKIDELIYNKGFTSEASKSYINSYERKYLLTLNEKAQFRKLQCWAERNGFIIFTKVRILDLITPRQHIENYKGALWKIQAKHVDFLICDQDIRVKCVVEILDSSHKKQERIERDIFVNEVLEACGYTVLQTHNITEEQLDNICGYNN